MSDIFIQWKGTSLCADLTCDCGENDHICRAEFAYYVKCRECGAVYRMGSKVEMTRVPKADGAAEACVDFGGGDEEGSGEDGL